MPSIAGVVWPPGVYGCIYQGVLYAHQAIPGCTYPGVYIGVYLAPLGVPRGVPSPSGCPKVGI